MSETQDPLAGAKAIQRRKARAARQLLAADLPLAGKALLDHLPPAWLSPSGIVSGYVSLGSEIDPLPLMRHFQTQGWQICLPVPRDDDAPLIFRAWDLQAKLRAGRHNTQIPGNGPWLVPDLILVPLLAFDARGGRLGQGGGYYDRTLQVMRNSSKIRAVGVAYAGQQVDSLPQGPLDQRLDYVLTDAGLRGPFGSHA